MERILGRQQERADMLQQMARESFGLAAAAPDEERVLLAEGDSWFDYPGTDVLDALEDAFGYDVRSVSHRGDTLESMAYDEKQLDGLSRQLAKLAEANKKPSAILLSAGGNDIAGDEFALLLDHRRSRSPGLNDTIVRGIVEERLREAYEVLIEKISLLHEEQFHEAPRRVIVHGYAHPVPDGRGYLGGFWFLPGPWLRPGFLQRGFEELDDNTRVMEDLIDRFNQMLEEMAVDLGGAVTYLDLRDTLSNELTDRRWEEDWDNELHPEEPGFARIAAAFHRAIGAQ